MWKPEHRLAADRSGLRYPSDLTDAEWRSYRPQSPSGRQGGRRRSVNVREVLNGIVYVLWSGCQWKRCPRNATQRPLCVLPPRHDPHHAQETDGSNRYETPPLLIGLRRIHSQLAHRQFGSKVATYSDEGSRNVVALAVVTRALRLSHTIAFGTPRKANVLTWVRKFTGATPRS